ncbi:MAG: hypothetical protein NUK62_03420 [Tenericutes bacterium]|nr:hypothetical protein [Mycoplasmatota bacterium]
MAVKEDVGMAIKMNVKCFKDIILLDHGQSIDESQILDLIDFVNNRYDCADFRLICLIRAYLGYKELISKNTISKIEQAIFDFKYWMDEPGEDGMCFWSENHQLLFHTCEYLAGITFPDKVFTNDGKTGKEHAKKARPKIMRWLKYKFQYGFIEWHSNTYYEEDIAPLAVLIDFANDDEMIEKSKIIMDLLFLDMAMHSYDGYFVSSNGRCYEDQKINRELADVNDILAHAFGIQKREYDYQRISSMFLLCKNYRVPKIIKELAKVKGTQIIKDSMGLNLKEVKKEIPNDEIDDRGMFLWQMEAFTNKESIDMTMKIFNAWNLHENNFLKDLKSVNVPILRKLNLLPLVVKILNPATQGVAIERANTYTYKTDYYMLSTAQKYHPKSFGDQQHIWQATLPNDISIFSTHPGSPMFDDAARNFSPSFWVGNGINPHAVQDKNIVLLMYDLTARKGYLERNRLMYIHFYFPTEKFDEVIEKDRKVFAKTHKSYIGIICSNGHEINNKNELIVEGKKSQFIVILGDEKQDESFEKFIEKIESYKYKMTNKKIVLKADHHYQLSFNKAFKIDGVVQNTEYDRYDTPYVESKRKPENLTINYNNKTLYLDFDRTIRKEISHAG